MHLIASRLKLPGTVFRGKLSLIQRIRATVSHPSVTSSSSGGMGLQTTRPLTASSSHAPTPCALARRIFSIGDNIWSIDNLWIAYCLIWSINIECQSVQPWVLSDCVRHTLVIFQIVDNFSTLIHSSFFKCNSRFPPEIRDVALSKSPQVHR